MEAASATDVLIGLRAVRASQLGRTAIAAVAALALTSARAAAQTADSRVVQPERPSVATHAYTVAPGVVEVETGFQRMRKDGRFRISAGALSVKLGLAHRLQFTTGIASTWPAIGGDGIDDVSAGIKWRVADRAPGAGAVAILPAVRFSAGSERVADETTFGIVAIVSRWIGVVSLDLNLAYARAVVEGDEPDTNGVVWAVSLGGPIAGRFGWLGEVSGVRTTPAEGGDAHVVSVMVGGTVSVARSLTCDVALTLPTDGADGRAFITGLSWNVVRLWSR